jgi:putative endonuclease
LTGSGVPRSIVALLLRLKGYRLLAKAYKTPVGAIDFVALKDRRLAFMEVRRRGGRCGSDWTLPARQRRRLLRAAQYWLAEHPDFRGLDIAFDVVLTAPLTWPCYITQIRLQ